MQRLCTEFPWWLRCLLLRRMSLSPHRVGRNCPLGGCPRRASAFLACPCQLWGLGWVVIAAAPRARGSAGNSGIRKGQYVEAVRSSRFGLRVPANRNRSSEWDRKAQATDGPGEGSPSPAGYGIGQPAAGAGAGYRRADSEGSCGTNSGETRAGDSAAGRSVVRAVPWCAVCRSALLMPAPCAHSRHPERVCRVSAGRVRLPDPGPDAAFSAGVPHEGRPVRQTALLGVTARADHV